MNKRATREIPRTKIQEPKERQIPRTKNQEPNKRTNDKTARTAKKKPLLLRSGFFFGLCL
jgi:hypothetical protein